MSLLATDSCIRWYVVNTFFDATSSPFVFSHLNTIKWVRCWLHRSILHYRFIYRSRLSHFIDILDRFDDFGLLRNGRTIYSNLPLLRRDSPILTSWTSPSPYHTCDSPMHCRHRQETYALSSLAPAWCGRVVSMSINYRSKSLQVVQSRLHLKSNFVWSRVNACAICCQVAQLYCRTDRLCLPLIRNTFKYASWSEPSPLLFGSSARPLYSAEGCLAQSSSAQYRYAEKFRPVSYSQTRCRCRSVHI